MSHMPFCRLGLVVAPLISLISPMLLWPAATLAQQQVYRSVDAQGNVSFSAEPPSGENIRRVESVELQPGPSEAERQAAEARARDMQQAADAYDQRRQAARDEASKQPEAPATAKPSSQQGSSSEADQWNDLLVNDRELTPEQRQNVDEAKHELSKAGQKRREFGSGDLYKRPDNYQSGSGRRRERE